MLLPEVTSNPRVRTCWETGWSPEHTFRFHRWYLALDSQNCECLWWCYNTVCQKKSQPSTYRCMKKPGQNTRAPFERIHCPCPHQNPSQQLLQLWAWALRSPCLMEVQRTFLFSLLDMPEEPDSHKPGILQVWSEPKTANIIQADLHGSLVTGYWLNQFPLGAWCNHRAGVNADIVPTRMRIMQGFL